MPKIISNEFFENRKQQAAIRTAIVQAIPEDVAYFNLIIALSDLLSFFVNSAFRDDVFNKKNALEGLKETKIK
jgi:hypothetical protein